MMREQSAGMMPSTDDAAAYSMNQEEADELFEQLSLHLAEHGEEDHRTKAVLDRIEQLGLSIQFAMEKAMKLDKNFGVEKKPGKFTKDVASGTGDKGTEGDKKGAFGTGAGTADKAPEGGKKGKPYSTSEGATQVKHGKEGTRAVGAGGTSR